MVHQAPSGESGASSTAEAGSAAWWAARLHRPERARRPRADGLTLDRILDGALNLVDTEGLNALTMRRLAGELGCGHASLYRHVASHQEVVVLLVDRVLGLLALPLPDHLDLVSGSVGLSDPSATVDANAVVGSDAGAQANSIDGVDPGTDTASAAMTTGRARAEAALRRYRQVLLAHPALTPAFLHGQLLGPNAMARREEALTLLLESGATPALAVRAYLSLTHFVIASAAFEASGAGRTEGRRREMDDYFATLPVGEYPTVVAMASELNSVNPDEEFDLGLAALLDHFEAQIVRSGSGRD